MKDALQTKSDTELDFNWWVVSEHVFLHTLSSLWKEYFYRIYNLLCSGNPTI